MRFVLFWLMLVSILTLLAACPPDDDDNDNDDATPVDDDTTDDDTADDDDSVDDDDDTTDDDSVDDDTIDDDTIDDDTVDDDSIDDDTIDDDSVDDDTVDDDSIDDDTIDDDTGDDDTADDDTGDDDTTGGDFWTYDFENDVVGEPPASSWSEMSVNGDVFRVYNYGGEHGKVMVLNEGTRKENPLAIWGWITYNWVNLQPFQQDFNLEMAVYFTDRRTSRFIIKRSIGSWNYDEWTYRITATGDTVDLFIDHPQRDEEWTYCGSFPADEWHNVTFAVRPQAHQASLLIDDQPTACLNVDWAIGGDGWFSGFTLDHAGGHNGSGFYDDFRAYHPIETVQSAPVEANDDDDDLTYAWIDGDSEYRVYGDVSLGIDNAGDLYFLYPKYNHAYYEDCNYTTLYDAVQSGDTIALAAPVDAGSCYIHDEYHYYTEQYYNMGHKNALASLAANSPAYLYTYSHYGYTNSFFGWSYSYAGALLYTPRGGEPVTIDSAEAGDWSMSNGANHDLVQTADGVVHVAYDKNEYHEFPTPPYYAYFKLAYTNSDIWDGDPEIVDDSASFFFGVKLLTDETDAVRILYARADVNYQVVSFHLAEKSGGVWTIQTLLDGLNCYQPKFAVDPDGHLHTIYTQNFKLIHGTNASGDWVFEPILDPYVDTPIYDYMIDPAGFLHLVYTQNDDSQLFYATNRNGLWEMTELPLVAPVDSALALAQDDAGDLHVALNAATRLWRTSFDPDDLPADFWQGDAR
mgnify:CR=1 FL=1